MDFLQALIELQHRQGCEDNQKMAKAVGFLDDGHKIQFFELTRFANGSLRVSESDEMLLYDNKDSTKFGPGFLSDC